MSSSPTRWPRRRRAVGDRARSKNTRPQAKSGTARISGGRGKAKAKLGTAGTKRVSTKVAAAPRAKKTIPTFGRFKKK